MSLRSAKNCRVANSYIVVCRNSSDRAIFRQQLSTNRHGLSNSRCVLNLESETSILLKHVFISFINCVLTCCNICCWMCWSFACAFGPCWSAFIRFNCCCWIWICCWLNCWGCCCPEMAIALGWPICCCICCWCNWRELSVTENWFCSPLSGPTFDIDVVTTESNFWGTDSIGVWWCCVTLTVDSIGSGGSFLTAPPFRLSITKV